MGAYSRKKGDLLARRLKDGDQRAAAELVDAYYERIYLYMRRLGHGRGVSEDLTQETFMQAWRRIGQLRDAGALNSWLYRIAGNMSRLYWRGHKGEKAVSIDDFELSDGTEGQWEKVEHLEQLGRLRDAVVGLPVKLRQVVVLHYMQHLTIAEAADVLGLRNGTFKSRLNRALKALRKQLE